VRYTLEKRYVEQSERKWWEYLVQDTFSEMVFGEPKVICVCSEEKDAQAICDALNGNRGNDSPNGDNGS
jgi:hypothetical protein